MLSKQASNLFKNFTKISNLKPQGIKVAAFKNQFNLLKLQKYSFSSNQENTTSQEQYQAIQWQIQQLNSTKNKEKHFQLEILSKLNNLDSKIVADILKCMKDHSFNKLSLVNFLKKDQFISYEMNDLEIQQVQELFQTSQNPKKFKEFIEIMSFLMDDGSKISQQIGKGLDIHNFQKEFNLALLASKDDVELNQILEWITKLQEIDPSIEMNGILNEKTFDILYDLSAKEWLDLLKIIKLKGNIDIELIKEMDKEIAKQSDIFYEDTRLFSKYMSMCANKDFKPANIVEYEKHLKKLIIEQKRVLASQYIESIQYINKQYVQDTFDELMKVATVEEIEQNFHSKDLLRQYNVIPDQYRELKEMIEKKNYRELNKYIRERIEQTKKEHSIQIEELFLITKHIYDTHMMQRSSDSKKLNLPGIITEDEMKLVVEMTQIVNRFMKEKTYRKANSLKQFLEVCSISYFMGFDKQQKECYDTISPQYLKQFQSVFILPLIIEFGKLNNQLLFDIIPVYSEYINNKYIIRNQLTFGEAFKLMKSIHQIKDVYIEQNAKYHYKEFIYGMKTLIRLVVDTFQKRIYANYKDIKADKQIVDNFFMEKKETKWQNDKDKVEIASDLSESEIDQLLQVYNLLNQMNVGSKQFYDSMEELIIKYYDNLNLSQKALASYILSTLEAQNETIEKKIEQTILSTPAFSLDQSVQQITSFHNKLIHFFFKIYSLKFDFSQFFHTHINLQYLKYMLSILFCYQSQTKYSKQNYIEFKLNYFIIIINRFLSYLTARYSLNEDLWKKLIDSLQKYDKEGKIIFELSPEYKQSLYLSRECLLLEQNHIQFPLSSNTIEDLAKQFDKYQLHTVNQDTAFTDAIKYFLDRLGYYYETNQSASIFRYKFSKLDQNNIILILDKWAFISDTKTQRSYISVMIRMLTKKNYKLKIFNVYDWASKDKRSEKITYLRSKVKGMSFDSEKQKKKSYFNF